MDIKLTHAPATPFNSGMPSNPTAAPPPVGFTLFEMLVVITVIGILAAMLFPSLAGSKRIAQGNYCMNNGHQMITALHLYTDDYNDFFPPNPDDGNADPGYNWCSGEAGIGQPQEFDPDVLSDPSRSLLISYLGHNVKVFRCPADTRQGLYQGNDPALVGKVVPAARTFSMSQAVGTIDPCFADSQDGERFDAPHCGVPDLPVNGPWLNGAYLSNHHDDPWATYGKFSAVALPSPAMLWVFVDENADGLNDAAFAFQMVNSAWLDAPGSYHNGACGFAFADGHSEIHRWRASPVPHSAANETDWNWTQQRTSARVGQSQ
jgi:prepilin-type N-terminal cleavage/methylation domain-containing protein/prepilin-type processing-associated H-X9-DG protein